MRARRIPSCIRAGGGGRLSGIRENVSSENSIPGTIIFDGRQAVRGKLVMRGALGPGIVNRHANDHNTAAGLMLIEKTA